MSTVRRGNRGLGRGLGNLIPGSSEEEKAKTGETGTPESSKKSSSAKTGGTKSATKTTKAGTKAAPAKTGSKETAAKTGTKPSAVTGQVYIKVTDIEPNKEQPRKIFDENALTELAQSIKEVGVIQPIVVQKNGEFYKIIAGERRWRAAKLANLKEVPVIIKKLTEQEVVEISLIENIQRENLNPIEEAIAYKRLLTEFNLKQDEVAERVSKSRTAVTNAMRLLKLSEKVQQMLIDEMITAGHARAILSIADKEKQESIAMKVFDEKLSVRETEALVKRMLEPPKTAKKSKFSSAEDAIYESLEEKMKSIMGTRVQIHRKKNDKGKIEIEYYSKDELERIIDLFESIG